MKEPPPHIDDLAHAVIGAAIEVHRQLGPGYLESVYEEALAEELEMRGIPYERQKTFMIPYKDVEIGQGRCDFLIAKCLIVEVKAVEQLAPVHQAQVISYLKALKLPLGLLTNFNVAVLKEGIKRIVLT